MRKHRHPRRHWNARNPYVSRENRLVVFASSDRSYNYNRFLIHLLVCVCIHHDWLTTTRCARVVNSPGPSRPGKVPSKVNKTNEIERVGGGDLWRWKRFTRIMCYYCHYCVSVVDKTRFFFFLLRGRNWRRPSRNKNPINTPSGFFFFFVEFDVRARERKVVVARLSTFRNDDDELLKYYTRVVV